MQEKFMNPDSQDKKKKLRSNHSGRTVSMLGMFTAAAMICSYIESLIPINFGIPGIKLGLANLDTSAIWWFCWFYIRWEQRKLSPSLFSGLF